MKLIKTPQEKKKNSYKKDRRNVFGENNKSSRKSIKRRKSWVNQTYRRTVNQVIKLATTNPDEIIMTDIQVKNIKRKFWKKYPDEALGQYLRDKGKRN